MTSAVKDYYYFNQMENYYIQFMAIFAGLQVQIGKNDRSGDEEKLIPVPIMNGNRDRVAGWIKAGWTHNKLLRVPIMAANITGITMSPELRKGIGQRKRNAFLPRGGMVPDDIEVVEQYMPVPYIANADLSIWVSNHQQRYQILEQILAVFDPSVQIQKNDAIFDWTKITTVELTNIAYEDNYPIGGDQRLLISTLSFTFPIYITAPGQHKQNFVKDIYARIGVVSQSADGSEEMIAELEAQGINYERWFAGDDVTLP